ncbi:MAG: hypothetical protein RI932_1745 [Pseudomonadota bacterium]|jgi:hypothetical protein
MLKRNTQLVAYALLTCVAGGYSACGKKKSSGSNDSSSRFAVSGQLAIQSNLEMASSAPNVVYALPAKVIENIYSFDKSMLETFSIGADGKFSANVKTSFGDTLLVAVDSNAANRLDGIRGVLSLKDDSGSLMKIPAAEGSGSLDMGTLSSDTSGKEYTSNKKTDEVSSSFSLDVSKMKEIAKTDDSARGLINVVANIKDNGDFVFAKPYMVFKSNIQKIKNTASAATDLTYNGYGLYFIAKWSGLTMESLCGGASASNKLSLVPPSGTQLKLCKENDSTQCRNYSEVTNLKTKSVETEGNGRSSCSSDMSGQTIAADDGNFYVAKEANTGGMTRPLGFNWGGGGYDGQLAQGVWTLKLNGGEVGRYDLAAANPLNASGKATVYVPSVKAVLDGSNKVTRIDVEWFLWNSASQSYEKVTATDTFSRVVSEAGAEIADYSGGCSSRSVYNQLTGSGATQTLDVSSFGATFPDSNYSNNSPSGCYAEAIAVNYTMNGVSYRFDFRPFYN